MPLPEYKSLKKVKKAEAQEESPSLWDRIGRLPGALATGVRIGSGVLASPGGWFGAGVSAAGEGLAELVEDPLRPFEAASAIPEVVRHVADPTTREATLKGGSIGAAQGAGRIGVAAGLGAVPASALLAPSKFLASGAKSAALGTTGYAANELVSGRDVDPATAAKVGGLSFLLGGTMGKLASPGTIAPSLDDAARLEAANAARTAGGKAPRNPNAPVPSKLKVYPPSAPGTKNDERGLIQLLQGGLKAKQTAIEQAQAKQDKIGTLLSKDIEAADKEAGRILAEDIKLAQIQAQAEAAGARPQSPTFTDTLTGTTQSGTKSTMRIPYETEADRLAKAAKDAAKKNKGKLVADEGPINKTPAGFRPPEPPAPVVATPPSPPAGPSSGGAAVAPAIEDTLPAVGDEFEAAARALGIKPKPVRGKGAKAAKAAAPVAAAPVAPVAQVPRKVEMQAEPVIESIDPTLGKAAKDAALGRGIPKGVPEVSERRYNELLKMFGGRRSTDPAERRAIPNRLDRGVEEMFPTVESAAAAPVVQSVVEPVVESAPATFYKGPLDAAGQNYRAIKDALGIEPKLKETLGVDTKGRPVTAERIAGKAARQEAAKVGLAPGTQRVPPGTPSVPAPMPELRSADEIQEEIAQRYLARVAEGQPALTGEAADAATARMLREDLAAMEAAAAAGKPVAPPLAPMPKSGRAAWSEPVTPQAQRAVEPTAVTEGVVQPGHPGMVGKLAAEPVAAPTPGLAPGTGKPKLVKTPKAPKAQEPQGQIFDEGIVEGPSTPVPPGSGPVQGLSKAELKNLEARGITAEQFAGKSLDELRGILKTPFNPNKGDGTTLGAGFGGLQQMLGLAQKYPEFATKVAMTAAGAGVGAITGEDPVTGAFMGGTAGLGLSYAPAALAAIGARVPSVQQLNDTVASQGTYETAKKIVNELPHVQRFNHLMSGQGLVANAVVGPYMSGLTTSIEAGLKGDPRGWAAAKLMLEGQPFKNIPESWEQAKGLIESSERRTLGSQPNVIEKGLAAPGRVLTTGDLSVRNVLRQAGFTEEEAKVMTLTSEPTSKLGKAAVNFQRTSGPIGNMMLPFVRTPMNILEQGAQRLPVVGGLYGLLKGKTAREVGAEQLLSIPTAIGSYEAGQEFGPGSPNARRYVSNAGGPNALTSNLFFALGQESAKTNPNMRNALALGAANAVAAPQTDVIEDWVKFGDNGNFPPGSYPKFFDEVGDALAPVGPESVPTNVPRSLSNIPLRRRGQ